MIVSVLVCTLNEEANIRLRIENLNALLPPSGEVIVRLFVLDNGSTDKTVEIAEGLVPASNYELSIITLPPIGKCGSLFWAFKNIDSDYFILTDANTFFAKDVMVKFISNFKDHPLSSTFIGNFRPFKSFKEGLCFLESTSTRFSLRLFIESTIGKFSGANGACYAVSKKGVLNINNLPPVRNDDFIISIFSSSNRDVIFDYSIKAFEIEDLNYYQTFKHKFRDSLGHYQALQWLYRYYDSWSFPIFFRLFFWFAPILFALISIVFFPYFFFLLALVLLVPKFRLLAARTLGLCLGFFIGAVKQPSVSWNVERTDNESS
jgi:glycosyltransferase involved in cell wall biosynthesis